MLIERVRRALEPDYEILEEIAGGGMGLVFSARQRRLDRKVAIKILRPEQATAIGAERFLTEGRVLARLAHPNIVPIYDAGEADGLLYYVMEYVEGETLADRLLRGPLSAQEALAAVRDLLSALGAAHARGIVHRDVKPANIFLREGRALLGDFGIARWREQQAEGFTTPGEVIGTPRYMSPEQRDGLPATARTDVYAAGLVVYEACSGARWPNYQQPKAGDWSSLPPALALPVRRALELAPEDRWADASEFAKALNSAGPRRSRILVPTLALLLLAAAGAGYWWIKHPGGAADGHPGLTIVVEPFAGSGRALGDSVASEVRDQLGGYPDFNVLPVGQEDRESTVLRIGGTVVVSGDRVSLAAQDHRNRAQHATPLTVRAQEGRRSNWLALADSLAADLVQAIWGQEQEDLPSGALPRTSHGRLLYFRAEQLWSLARWEEAAAAYLAAERNDSTCLLCSFRLLDVARWLGEEQDTARLHRLQREQALFTPVYQSLIHAMSAPLPGRLDTLENASNRWRKFFLATFVYGDELFHRGPLYGHPRADAEIPLRQTVLNAPHFDPGWEHFAFFLIGQGDSARADSALSALGQAPPASQFSAAFRMLLSLGFAWRFLEPEMARTITEKALGQPAVLSNPEATAGARLLMTMDAPRGAIELGGMLAALHYPAALRGGLLGQLDGYSALGQLDLLRLTGARLRRAGLESEALLALELEAVLRCFDPDTSLCPDASLRGELQRRLATSPLGRRAAWALGLLAIRSFDPALTTSALRELASEPGGKPLTHILDAAALLSRGQWSRALDALPHLQPLEAEKSYDDPLEDAVVRLLRSEAEIKLQRLADARDGLRWHEHVQLSGHMTDDPQAGEMGWALGTLVRWKRTQLLDSFDSGTIEHCVAYSAVARLWSGAPAPFGIRADSAKRALTRLHCETAP